LKRQEEKKKKQKKKKIVTWVEEKGDAFHASLVGSFLEEHAALLESGGAGVDVVAVERNVAKPPPRLVVSAVISKDRILLCAVVVCQLQRHTAVRVKQLFSLRFVRGKRRGLGMRNDEKVHLAV
jgi:hypothetical protein